MFIQTEPTPNPATLKFLPGRPVMESGVADFTTIKDAQQSPLANSLFNVEGITGVFFGTDFITVTKTDDMEWQVIKPLVLGAIMDHYTSGHPLLLDGASSAAEEEIFDDADADPDVIEQIKELIETRVRPAVAQDGGDIIYKGFKGGTVFLHMRGACAGCPSPTMTLKSGIENMLRHYVPEVTQVEAVM
jgi:Fe-S cluster biogenesis protein NfuA